MLVVGSVRVGWECNEPTLPWKLKENFRLQSLLMLHLTQEQVHQTRMHSVITAANWIFNELTKLSVFPLNHFHFIFFISSQNEPKIADEFITICTDKKFNSIMEKLWCETSSIISIKTQFLFMLIQSFFHFMLFCTVFWYFSTTTERVSTKPIHVWWLLHWLFP